LTEAPPLTATALKWVDDTITAIKAADTIADLAELEASKARGLARLEGYPEHGQITQMFADRREALDGGAEWGDA
jgi:hypothetical protein